MSSPEITEEMRLEERQRIFDNALDEARQNAVLRSRTTACLLCLSDSPEHPTCAGRKAVNIRPFGCLCPCHDRR